MSLHEAWWGRLGGVRWFGGKGAAGAITALEPLGWYTAPGVVPAVRSEIATIDYADGRREFYHLLVAHYAAGTAPVEPLLTLDDVDVVDATADPEAVRVFIAACGAGVADMAWAHPLPPAAQAKVWAGEQSNTTITWDSTALFKLFRKIEPGTNLDAEVLGALDGSGVAVPSLLGRLTAAWPAGQVTDLGMVIERVAGASDGWDLACASCAASDDFTAEASALGQALRAVHTAMHDLFGTGTLDGDLLSNTMEARLETALAAAPVLADFEAALTASFDSLRGQTIDVQRVHGDFHLGQTLRSASGWTIIDFEGEPAKSAAERRTPDSVWRDVAGMLRSFDYVRSAHTDPESDAARRWAADAHAAFLRGYCGPTDAPADLLAAYETDKAVYEVVYETRNRPDWVAIPLRAVADRAAAPHTLHDRDN